MANFLFRIIAIFSISLMVAFLFETNSKLFPLKSMVKKLSLAYINRMKQAKFAQSRPPIPRHIIQVSPLKLKDSNRSSFVRLNVNHTYYSFGAQESEEFVQKHMPSHIVQMYKSMPKAILKADFFRYIALMVLGGVYTDMDTECLHPIDTWLDVPRERVGLILSLEMDDPVNWKGVARPIQFCQWTFAGVAGHPILRNTLERIVTIAPRMLAQKMSYDIVMNWTGPGLWSDVVLDYLHQHFEVDTLKLLTKLDHPVLIGDIYIFPKNAFAASNSNGKRDSRGHVRHFFHGTWKADRDMKN